MKTINCILFLVFFQLIVSCNQDAKKVEEVKPLSDEELIGINKSNVIEEQEQIADYIQRHRYQMQTSETGLHSLSIAEGKGQTPIFRSSVTMNYTVNFLNGDYCYSSDSSGVLQFIMGQSDEPSGLQEGLSKMKAGGQALFIIPSYLAYGLTGDGNKIGPNKTLVYQVELLKVE